MPNCDMPKMSRWGIGPACFTTALLIVAVVLALHWYKPDLFCITCVPYSVLTGLGIFLIILGLMIYIPALITVMRAYNKNSLCTTGVYGLCRHPVYAAWVVFITPGIMLLLKSWIGLLAAGIIFIIVRLWVLKEDLYLLRRFPDEYPQYHKTTPALLPLGWLKHGPSPSD